MKYDKNIDYKHEDVLYKGIEIYRNLLLENDYNKTIIYTSWI